MPSMKDLPRDVQDLIANFAPEATHRVVVYGIGAENKKHPLGLLSRQNGCIWKRNLISGDWHYVNEPLVRDDICHVLALAFREKTPRPLGVVVGVYRGKYDVAHDISDFCEDLRGTEIPWGKRGNPSWWTEIADYIWNVLN